MNVTTTTTHETPVAEMTLTELREEYRILRRNSEISATHEEWDAAVERGARKLSGCDSPEPMEYVESARAAVTCCDKCHGTGEYQWGGTINGKPVHTGVCYRCEGKGHQNQDDYRRNYVHTCHAIRRACGL
jgi:hypothetical protein